MSWIEEARARAQDKGPWWSGMPHRRQYCHECSRPYPCPTVRAILGEGET